MRLACLLTLAAAVHAQYARYDPASQRYQEELLRRQQYERAQQQQYAQAQRAQQQEALLRAQREALLAQSRGSSQNYQSSGSSYPGGSKPPLTKKQQKEAKKKQAEDAKTLKKLQEANQKLRKKAQGQSQGFPSAAGSRRAVGRKRGGGPLSFVFSWKGLLLAAASAAAYVVDKELLMGKLLKYPAWFASWLLRALWNLALKPLVRFVVLRGKGGGGAELPGGSY